MEIPWENIIKILAAFLAGGLLGYEREYRDKPAGLRTLIMITVGSTLFAMLSLSIRSDSPDRIASNIVTGVGFVGAGVIFKEGLNIRGVTTAATIWIAASVGMALGFGEYELAFVTLLLVLLALTALSRFAGNIDTKIQTQLFKLSFEKDQYSVEQIEEELTKMKLVFERTHLGRIGHEITAIYKIIVPSSKSNELLTFFINSAQIKSFDF